MSKDLKRRGFNFVGSTICYAFMQAVGMVNDHPWIASATTNSSAATFAINQRLRNHDPGNKKCLR